MKGMSYLKILLSVVIAMGLQMAWVVRADEPLRQVVHLDPEEVTFNAGEYCTFPYSITVEGDIIVQDFYQDGVRIMRIVHEIIDVTHKNLDTGQFVTESDHFSFKRDIDLNNLQEIVAFGNFWHLRNEDGKIVLVHAGRVTSNDPNGDTKTPNAGNFPGNECRTICPVLGGEPALGSEECPAD